jgi:hypothetical protein
MTLADFGYPVQVPLDFLPPKTLSNILVVNVPDEGY